MSKIVLYSNHCPQCKVLESKLKSNNITFSTIEDIDLMIEKGFRSMPMLQIGDDILNYAEALQWVNQK